MVYISVVVLFLWKENSYLAIFLIISRHSPENCPINNEQMKKITLELPKKLGTLEQKHGVKRIGVWTVIPEHLTVWVYEATNPESLQKFSMEPDIIKWMAWNTNEIKLAVSLEESIRLLNTPNMNWTPETSKTNVGT
jgi:hypothetical protein